MSEKESIRFQNLQTSKIGPRAKFKAANSSIKKENIVQSKIQSSNLRNWKVKNKT